MQLIYLSHFHTCDNILITCSGLNGHGKISSSRVARGWRSTAPWQPSLGSGIKMKRPLSRPFVSEHWVGKSWLVMRIIFGPRSEHLQYDDGHYRSFEVLSFRDWYSLVTSERFTITMLRVIIMDVIRPPLCWTFDNKHLLLIVSLYSIQFTESGKLSRFHTYSHYA